MDEKLVLYQWAGEWLGNRLTTLFNQVQTPFDIRTQAVHAMLREISQLSPDEYDSFESLQEMLGLASRVASSDLLDDLAKRHPLEAKQAIQEEIERFSQALEALDRKQLTVKTLSPLPFARELSRSEASMIWAEVVRTWELNHNHWYPIYGPPRPPNTLAFLAEMFEANLVPTKLRNILRAHESERVYEFSEFSPLGIQSGWPETEMGIEFFVPRYGQIAGGEGYWFSPQLDWLIYASHEKSITVGGEWLIEAIKQAWPDWEEGLYEKYPIARFHLGDYQPDA